MNQQHLRRLREVMYNVQDFSALDDYGSKIFGRPIKGTWKIFRHIASKSIGDVWWGWKVDRELASYPNRAKVQTFEEFATFMLHEVTHGWCHFLKDDPSLLKYPTGVDEEQVCWDVSRLVCGMLNISYQDDVAKLCHQFYLLAREENIDGIRQLLEKMPVHLRL